uniref:substrate-binding domain-containing protein n=1 Tax=Mediterraneibacter gnavus TaxID=33038 RepID=UPI00402A5DCA
MRMKRFVSVLAAAVMVFGVTGCNAITIDGETENVSGEAAGNGSIGFSVSTLNNPFFVTLSEGAKEKAKTEGEKLIVVDAGDDAAKQTSDIEDLISKNISVLIVNPVDSDAVAPAVKDAVSRGIKVISVDRGVNGVDVDCAIASDNVEGAKMATEYMVSLLGENAKVAELEGVSGASATIERGKGFHLVADKKLNVVSKQTANFSRSFFADSSYMLSFSVLCSCVCSRLISPSVSSWHKQDNTLMHQSPGHIQRRTPYNF